jgi:iron complex outermembrane receptor protein
MPAPAHHVRACFASRGSAERSLNGESRMVPRVTVHRTAAAALGCAMSAFAHAQVPRIDPVLVEGAPERSLTVPSRDAAQQEIRRVPGGATLVVPDVYESGRAATLADLLHIATGVYVQPRFGAQEARIAIRGSGLQRTFHGRGIVLLQDGVPLNLADGSFDMQAIEPLGLAYTQVLRGGNALQYGATTLGGAIDFVMPSGPMADRVRVRADGGSFGFMQAFVQGAGMAGNADYVVSGSYGEQDGYRDWSAQRNGRLFGNLGVRLSRDVETRFYVAAVDSDSELPGSVTRAQLESDPRQANPGNYAGRQKRDFPLVRIANKTTWRAGESTFDAAAFYSHKDLWHPIFQVIDQISNDFGASLRFATSAPLLGRANRFVAGFVPQWGKVVDNRYVNVQGAAGARTGESTQRSSNIVLFAENQHDLAPQWTLSLGAQATWATRDLDDRFLSNGDNSVAESYDRVSPKVGLLYRPSPSIDVFANYSGVFEPPTFGELAGGPNVTPVTAQRGQSYEIGTRGFLPQFQWDAVYYHVPLKGELLALNSPTGQPLGTTNASRTLHQGLELGFTLTTRSATWRTTYLYNDFRFDGDASYGDNRLPGVPRQIVVSELLFTPATSWFVGPTLEWVPQRYPVDMANTLFAVGYTLWGLKAGYRAAKDFSFSIEGRNLGNRRYAATTGVIADARGLDSAQFFPGDGRAFYAGIEWRL